MNISGQRAVAVILFLLAIKLAVLAGLVWVAIHFISKWW